EARERGEPRVVDDDVRCADRASGSVDLVRLRDVEADGLDAGKVDRRRAGCSPRALRYYEEQGLLAPQRTQGGQRRYTADAVRSEARERGEPRVVDDDVRCADRASGSVDLVRLRDVEADGLDAGKVDRRRAGCSPRALRYYEEQGLLAPQRTQGGQRRYPADAV